MQVEKETGHSRVSTDTTWRAEQLKTENLQAIGTASSATSPTTQESTQERRLWKESGKTRLASPKRMASLAGDRGRVRTPPALSSRHGR